jgi:hypothetical protein
VVLTVQNPETFAEVHELAAKTTEWISLFYFLQYAIYSIVLSSSVEIKLGFFISYALKFKYPP